VNKVQINNPIQEQKIIIIAGSNGAGKTTFAREFLPKEAGWRNFQQVYKSSVDSWALYDNSGETQLVVDAGGSL